MKVRILRQETETSSPYWEHFDYNGPAENSVAGVLDYLNYRDDMMNDQGARTRRIGWECSCMQGNCGACAMVINGMPALACETMIQDLKSEELEIRPLQKFPVLHDLITDRSSIQENLMKTNVYIGKYQPSDKGDYNVQYLAAKCLRCGLCLEVCPNYVNGETFFGAAFANDCYLVASRNREKVREIRHSFGDHFEKDCSKALSCMDVCPMRIPVISTIARLNRIRRKKGTP